MREHSKHFVVGSVWSARLPQLEAMLSELIKFVISDSSSYASRVLMLFVLQRVAESALVGVEVHHEVHGRDLVSTLMLICELPAFSAEASCLSSCLGLDLGHHYHWFCLTVAVLTVYMRTEPLCLHVLLPCYR